MKGKNVIGEANSSSSKRNRKNKKASSSSSKRNRKNKECEIDRISSLPDSVLAHILSFLPTQDAVKTLLLRRFGLLWATSDNLHFNACSFHDCCDIVFCDEDDCDRPRYDKRFINFIRHVLTLHERNPIHRFHLKCEFFKRFLGDEYYLQNQELVEREMRLGEEINTWTRFAIRREVKVLDLDFLACRGDTGEPEILYKVPEFVFNCDSIRELKLVYCQIEPRGQIHMRSLRTLFLKSVALKGNKIDDMVTGFPLLENVSLIKCYNLCKLNFVSPNLKYLKVVVRKYDNSRMEISGPNIISLDISGSVEQVDLKNLCSLKDAALGFKCCSRFNEDSYPEVRKVLENLNHAKVFTLYKKSILLWTALELMKVSFPSMLWKHLILKTYLTKEQLPGIASMLRSCPCLEILDIHTEGPWIYNRSYSRFGGEQDVENYWSKLDECCQCLSNNLQTVRIYGLVAEPCVLQLVQFLLKNLTGLEKMVITSERSYGSNLESCFSSCSLLKLSQKLLSLPRASASAVILFS